MALEDVVKTVAVHNRNFHADDVFAVAALRFLYPELKVIRTRDNDVINSTDVRIDVGFTYDHEKKTYDHHQKGGAGIRENGVPYSSFGLIWKHYGGQICGSDEFVKNIDENLVQKIDGVDTGYFKPNKDDLMRDFYLSNAIAIMNPSWQEENPDYDTPFNKAVNFAYDILNGLIEREKGKALARDIVRDAIRNRENESYIILDRSCPWEDTVVKESNISYVIYGEKTRWMVQAVPVVAGQYELRKPFPKEWAGATEEELRNYSGVKDAIFCHSNRFIASATSLEGAKKLAEISSRQ